MACLADPFAARFAPTCRCPPSGLAAGRGDGRRAGARDRDVRGPRRAGRRAGHRRAQQGQRSVAATLAQQDIERLRSYPITALSNYSRDAQRERGAASATRSPRETEWVRDASGVVSCTDDNTQAEYLKISSTVPRRAHRSRRRCKEVTLLTPAPGAFSATAGTAAIKLTDRDGNPLAAWACRSSGPAIYSDTTNASAARSSASSPPATTTANVSGRRGLGRRGLAPPRR